MCQPVSQFNLIFFVTVLLQEPEPEPESEPRARIRFRFFLGQNDTIPAVRVPVPQHCSADMASLAASLNFAIALAFGTTVGPFSINM
jgi:hypothetical protein